MIIFFESASSDGFYIYRISILIRHLIEINQTGIPFGMQLSVGFVISKGNIYIRPLRGRFIIGFELLKLFDLSEVSS